VLKYTPEATRSFATMQSQVDWVNFLATHGAPVSRPVPSRNGAFVEQLPINDAAVSVVCYEHVPGERPKEATGTAELFQRWGQVMGQIHALSTRYRPAQRFAPIRAWDEDPTCARRHIPADQTRVLEKFDTLFGYFYTLPKHPQVYGLIHSDLQANNLRVQQGKIWVIDFDDCETNWFVADLATALYFILWEPDPARSHAEFAAFALEHMVAGYRCEHTLDAEWIEQIPRFLKLQEMFVYVTINAYNQVTPHTDLGTLPPKHRALLQRYRHNIEQDIPYIESAYFPWA
jgi:Ser/Thr protein kinase RdoA (MazF antagonist)